MTYCLSPRCSYSFTYASGGFAEVGTVCLLSNTYSNQKMRLIHLSLSAVLACSSVLAQTAPCMSENDSTNAASSAFFGIVNGSPGTYAWQITPLSTVVVESITTFIRNQYMSQTGEFAKLSIWTESSTGTAPGQQLTEGTFRLTNQYSWRGCNFETPVVLQANTNYWIGLTEPGWTGVPIQSIGGLSLPMMRRDINTGAWTNMNAPEAFKYRLYCGKLDRAGVVPFGSACPNSAGSLGTAFVNSSPVVGNTGFTIEGSGFTPGTVVIGFVGITPAFPSLPLPGAPGCFVSTTADVTASLAAGVGDVRANSPDGHVEFPIAIPANPALSGFYFAAEFAALDLGIGTALPFVTSNALQITIN